MATGYPGPAFPPVTSPPDPDDQVGIIDGNSSGIIVDAVNARFVPGEEILAAVYSGTVMTIPDFALTVPSIGLDRHDPDPQQRDHDDGQQEQLVLGHGHDDRVRRLGRRDQPAHAGTLAPLTFSPNPATPATTVTWTTFRPRRRRRASRPSGSRATPRARTSRDHYYPVAVNDRRRRPRLLEHGLRRQVFAMATTGATATGTMSFSTPNSNGTAFAGPVTLTIEGGAGDAGVLPSGIGTLSVTPSTFTLSRGTTQAVSLSLGGGSLAAGEYPLTIRATGTNSDGQKVTRLVPIVLDIATGGHLVGIRRHHGLRGVPDHLHRQQQRVRLRHQWRVRGHE